MDNFFGPFLARVQPGIKVLDLGAGQGIHACWMARKGARVVAVDKKKPPTDTAGVRWIQSSIEEWYEQMPDQVQYDAILAKNVLQFLRRDWVIKQLLPELVSRLKPNGVLALETFYQSPEPVFEWLSETSHYTLEDLSPFFFNWKVLAKRQEPKKMRGIDGKRRKFFLTGLIVQRQENVSVDF
ncbi:MAG: class I SAM-dependent methyltransferase [Patescibacteria group bacterium]|nr:class I SAM-dependent methyltransferase [Patescibacteria group bacterium]MBU2509336.1 class I SAM-dependent methyltransferase [Patescibacteria group bacterium]